MGTHKTGSSALQVFFARNTKQLLDGGTLYPRRNNHQAAKTAAITSGNALELAHYMAERPGECRSLTMFKADMKEAGNKDILYSSETFNAFSDKRVTAFKRLASQFGYEIKCIFFVRSPAGYALSQYSQLVKRSSYKFRIERYLEKAFILPFSNIKSAIDMFGAERIHVYNYDAHRKSIQQYFWKDVLGIKNNKFEVVKEEVNRSLSQLELEFMRNINIMGGDESISTYISDALIYGQPDLKGVQKISKANMALVRKVCTPDLKYINSLGVKPAVKMRDESIRLGDTRKVNLNPFQKATLSILMKLAVDQVKS